MFVLTFFLNEPCFASVENTGRKGRIPPKLLPAEGCPSFHKVAPSAHRDGRGRCCSFDLSSTYQGIAYKGASHTMVLPPKKKKRQYLLLKMPDSFLC